MNDSVSGSFVLGILFVALKLCGVIGWSWWWVTAPFWIPAVVVALVFAGAAVVAWAAVARDANIR